MYGKIIQYYKQIHKGGECNNCTCEIREVRKRSSRGIGELKIFHFTHSPRNSNQNKVYQKTCDEHNCDKPEFKKIKDK